MTLESLERVETARMVCERLRTEHIPELTRLYLEPDVARWLYPHEPRPPAAQAAATSVTKSEQHWDRHGFGMWLLRDLHTGEALGRGGLQYTPVTGREEVEVGWAIMPPRWGEGLATELATASIAAAFDTLDLSEIIAYALVENGASRRVMEKTGFSYDSDLVHSGLRHVVYRLRRERC